jgi:pSer/pThr/pTyr-binding forkhead associated (FHA) protein
MESEEPFLDDDGLDVEADDSATEPRDLDRKADTLPALPARSAAGKPVGAAPWSEQGLAPFRSSTPVACTSLLLPEVASSPLELILQSPNGTSPEQLRIDESTILIGRGSQCDLRLAHCDVSRRHALLQRVGDRLLVVDLCSRTGVLRSGERVAVTWLGPGDDLQVGPYTLHWNGENALEANVDPAGTGMQLFSRQSINIDGIDDLGLRVFTEDGKLVASVPLERPITLAGRSPMCKLRLHDESVSRVHAGVMLSREGAFAVDLVRRGGLIVNGRTVNRSPLAVGDRLCIGRYRLEVVSGLKRTMPRVEPVQIAQTVIDTPPPTGFAPPMSGGVPETVVMALVGALSDLQRQFHEQSRYQMEVVQRLFESVRVDLRDEISKELRRLQELTSEIQATQQQMLRLPTSSPTEPHTAAPQPAATPSAETLPPPVETPHKPSPKTSGPATEPPKPTGMSEMEAAFEHAWIAERLRQLEQERSSGWEKLRRLLGSG